MAKHSDKAEIPAVPASSSALTYVYTVLDI